MHGVINQTTRTAATEEDGADHIGFETPRSGVATPQPDLQDKRLPGIMSYFGQVRQSSSSVSQRSEIALPQDQKQAECQSGSFTHSQTQALPEGSHHTGDSWAPNSLLHNEPLTLQPYTKRQEQRGSHPYPTPPISQTSSCEGSTLYDTSSENAVREAAARTDTRSPIPFPKKSSAFPFMTTHFDSSNDSDLTGADDPTSRSLSCTTVIQTPNTTSSQKPHPVSEQNHTRPAPSKWYSLDGLKELTRVVTFKSGPPTPTRALSTARPSTSLMHSRTSHDGETSGTQTPRTSSTGAQAPAPKGKLTIKITEARGLRKCRDPYVVVVFQRSELISGGPRPSESEDSLSIATPGMGGIPIQRQSSDSGRPMAIPMRSRQSSNTSISDYNTFRNRSARLSFTNPKWDAEAEL